MDVDDRQSLWDKLRQKKIDFALGRIEGSDPWEHSLKKFSEAEDRMRKKIEKRLRTNVSVSESDRRVSDSKPKHLFSGKGGKGKTDRR